MYVTIEEASYNTPASIWKIRCVVQPTHGFGYSPLMGYDLLTDTFYCECGNWITAEMIDRLGQA